MLGVSARTPVSLVVSERMVDMDVDMNSPGKSSFFTGVGKLLSEGPSLTSNCSWIQSTYDPRLAVCESLSLRLISCKSCFLSVVFFRHVKTFLMPLGHGLCSSERQHSTGRVFAQFMSLDDLEHAALSSPITKSRSEGRQNHTLPHSPVYSIKYI